MSRPSALAGWKDGTAFCFCDTVDPESEEPIPLDGRGILRRAVERVRGFGYEPVAATELEFHLCTPDWEPLYTGTHCYSMQKGADVEPVVSEMKRALEDSGIHVEAWNVEYGPAQVEVNLGHGSPIDVADATIILKYVVKQIATKHGLRATFMPKPYITEAGNGMHVHQSLLDADGRNAFNVEDDDPPLHSKVMRRYLSGLLAHQVDLQAVNCPTINAYKRVEDYSFAPTQVSWGLDNRLVGVRSAVGRGSATRLECRWASGGCQPVPGRRRLSRRRHRRARARAYGAADGDRRPPRGFVAHAPTDAARPTRSTRSSRASSSAGCSARCSSTPTRSCSGTSSSCSRGTSPTGSASATARSCSRQTPGYMPCQSCMCVRT